MRAVPCDLCGSEAPGRRHWLVATYVNGEALYSNLCPPCYRRCLDAAAEGARAPRWWGGELPPARDFTREPEDDDSDPELTARLGDDR